MTRRKLKEDFVAIEGEEDALDIFKDYVYFEDSNGKKLLSRADLILIFTFYSNGLEQFLDEYKEYVLELKRERGYVVVNKPHYYLKGVID